MHRHIVEDMVIDYLAMLSVHSNVTIEDIAEHIVSITSYDTAYVYDIVNETIAKIGGNK